MRGSTAYTCGLTLPPVGDEAVKHDHAILGVTLLDGALLDDALLNDAPIDDALLLVIRFDLFVLVLYIGDLLLVQNSFLALRSFFFLVSSWICLS